MKMLQGVVKLWKSGAGWGFIARDDRRPDIFVHINNCAADIRALQEGQRVSFSERESPRDGRLEACDVAVL